MHQIWLYSLISVFIVSLISFIGIITLRIQTKKLRAILIYIISFSAGALFGDTFIHLLPDLITQHGFTLEISIYLMVGIIVFFILEKIVHFQHYHSHIGEEHSHEPEGHEHKDCKPKPLAYINLAGGALHNFIDGLVIAGSYLVDINAGIATTIAVMLHEIPHELGDFGILVHAGYSKNKALLFNFLSALTSVLGAIVALWLNGLVEGISFILVPIAAGGFIYIAGSDLIPELHKEEGGIVASIMQLVFFILGIGMMFLMIFIGTG